jgi:hypothetical protein
VDRKSNRAAFRTVFDWDLIDLFPVDASRRRELLVQIRDELIDAQDRPLDFDANSADLVANRAGQSKRGGNAPNQRT